jgi:hypothetical protein
MYLVNLIQGSSTGFNAVSIESAQPCFGHQAVPDAGAVAANSFGFYRTRCGDEQGTPACFTTPPTPGACTQAVAYSDYTERIDGPNGDFAQTGTAGGFAGGGTPAIADSPLSIIARYLSISSLNATSELLSWRDRAPASVTQNVAVYDDAENVHSVTVSVANEVSFTVTADVITPGATDGWFRLKYPCGAFGSCTYNYDSPLSGQITPIQAMTFSVQRADSAGAGTPSSSTLRWDATFPAHRQFTNYFGISE